MALADCEGSAVFYYSCALSAMDLRYPRFSLILVSFKFIRHQKKRVVNIKWCLSIKGSFLPCKAFSVDFQVRLIADTHLGKPLCGRDQGKNGSFFLLGTTRVYSKAVNDRQIMLDKCFKMGDDT